VAQDLDYTQAAFFPLLGPFIKPKQAGTQLELFLLLLLPRGDGDLRRQRGNGRRKNCVHLLFLLLCLPLLTHRPALVVAGTKRCGREARERRRGRPGHASRKQAAAAAAGAAPYLAIPSQALKRSGTSRSKPAPAHPTPPTASTKQAADIFPKQPAASACPAAPRGSS